MNLNYDIIDTVGQYLQCTDNDIIKALCNQSAVPYEAVPQIEKNNKQIDETMYSVDLLSCQDVRLCRCVLMVFQDLQNQVTLKNNTLEKLRRWIIVRFRENFKEEIDKITFFYLKYCEYEVQDREANRSIRKDVLFEFMIKVLIEYVEDILNYKKRMI